MARWISQVINIITLVAPHTTVTGQESLDSTTELLYCPDLTPQLKIRTVKGQDRSIELLYCPDLTPQLKIRTVKGQDSTI